MSRFLDAGSTPATSTKARASFGRPLFGMNLKFVANDNLRLFSKSSDI